MPSHSERSKQLIDKIRKCLALAKSANEHEAAAAMAKARALMQQHGLELGDIEFDEATARGNGCSVKPPQWELLLIAAVRKVIPSEVILHNGSWRFFGRAPSAELAAYAFAVLHRQIKQARSGYIRGKLRRVRPGNKSARADQFCEGWVCAILVKLKSLETTATAPKADQGLLDHVRSCIGEPIAPLKANERTVKGPAANDFWRGADAGRNADLHRPMPGTTRRNLTGR